LPVSVSYQPLVPRKMTFIINLREFLGLFI
jgi:hypothetical protein